MYCVECYEYAYKKEDQEKMQLRVQMNKKESISNAVKNMIDEYKDFNSILIVDRGSGENRFEIFVCSHKEE